jgi:peptide-methionine (S)-S-oxide reductase
MPRPLALRSALFSLLITTLFSAGCRATTKTPVPPAVSDAPLASSPGKQTAVFAGGCFWGTQSVFERVKGVLATTAGYAGGSASTATYDQVTTETTGHAESVRVVYDPSKITYGQLLRVFFSVAHDPTQLNRQGPDVGTSYRSAIFYLSEEQQKISLAYIAQLDAAHVFPKPIVTQVATTPSPTIRTTRCTIPTTPTSRSATAPRSKRSSSSSPRSSRSTKASNPAHASFTNRIAAEFMQ